MPSYLVRRPIRKLPGIVIKAVPKPEPIIIEGFGARENVGKICANAGYHKVLLVTDQTLFSLGYHDKILKLLQENQIEVSVFNNISSEPTIEIISEGRNAAVNCGAQCIIALGGGSVLDTCKIIAAGAKYRNLNVKHLLHKFIYVGGKTLPIIAIPSTAGTGAEITVGAVVKNKREIKSSTVVIGLNVTHVILDSELTINSPEHVTVYCGIDALSHGLEGCLADIRTSNEDWYKSCECVRLVFENLPKLLHNPHDIEARQKMFLAAYYGGNAINKQLAGYVHAFAHAIGALYHIPHGKAIAHCLVPIVKYHRNICQDKLVKLSQHCGLSKASDDPTMVVEYLLNALKKLLVQCGIENVCGVIKDVDYQHLIHMINADSINYSPPKTLTNKEIKYLLDEIRKGTSS